MILISKAVCGYKTVKG